MGRVMRGPYVGRENVKKLLRISYLPLLLLALLGGSDFLLFLDLFTRVVVVVIVGCHGGWFALSFWRAIEKCALCSFLCQADFTHYEMHQRRQASTRFEYGTMIYGVLMIREQIEFLLEQRYFYAWPLTLVTTSATDVPQTNPSV